MGLVAGFMLSSAAAAAVVLVLLVSLFSVQQTEAGVIPVHNYGGRSTRATAHEQQEEGKESEAGAGRGLSLYIPPPLILNYHNGPLLTSSSGIPIYLLWYGGFSKSQKQTVADFLRSISPTNSTSTRERTSDEVGIPAVSTWWNTLTSYKDSGGVGVTPLVRIGGQYTDRACSLGRNLKLADIQTLVVDSVANAYFPADPAAVYLVLTAYNVFVEGFCVSSCGSHSLVPGSLKTKNTELLYAWVGNPGTQCPGYCAWPFAVEPFVGPPDFKPLVAPNGDIGADGMVINVATLLAGTATNPFNTGYYQGVASLPNEAATACLGSFGSGSFPGYPGHLLTDTVTNASFNAYGIHSREFLLPALWDPASDTCKTLT